MTALRRALAPVDGAMSRFRDSLTPGQRWTAVAALSLALALVGFGSPEHVLFEDGPTRRIERTARPAPPTAGSDGGTAVTAPSGPVALPGPVSGGSTIGRSDGAESIVPAQLVALVSGDTDAPRSDAAMAQAFLDARQLTAPVVSIDDADACTRAREAGASVALASFAVPPELRECLAEEGVRLVTHDALAWGADVVTTRWGVDRVLAELGRWGSADSLRGRVGVVATPDAEALVERGLRGWADRGIDVESVEYVGGDSGASEADVVREFASGGVQVVVLAVPVDVQRRIAGFGAVLLGSARYVVADSYDSVWDEGYAPTFDGAVAFTTARGSWFGRAHGDTQEQLACRQTWEGAATPGVMLEGEALRVYAWCAVTELAARAVAGGVRALTASSYESPLTSELVVDGDDFGPGAWAVVVWRSNCGCWTERDPFAR